MVRCVGDRRPAGAAIDDLAQKLDDVPPGYLGDRSLAPPGDERAAHYARGLVGPPLPRQVPLDELLGDRFEGVFAPAGLFH
jgi:hypothetical protein